MLQNIDFIYETFKLFKKSVHKNEGLIGFCAVPKNRFNRKE